MNINWNKKPYSQEQFHTAWNNSTLVNDVAHELGTAMSVGSLRALNRTAQVEGLDPKYVWNRDYTPKDFKEAWNRCITKQDVARELGAKNTHGFDQMREALDLPEKASATSIALSTDQFTELWEQSETLDDVIDHLNLNGGNYSNSSVQKVAKTLGLPSKQRRIYTTETGEDASSIIADWLDWYRGNIGVYPLDTHVKVLSKKVKQLIKAEYPTMSIKFGLYKWTVSQETQYANYNILDSEARRHFLQQNAENAQRLEALRNADPEHNAPRHTPIMIEERNW